MNVIKKLSINLDKIIKKDELIHLKGGYGGGYGSCGAKSDSGSVICNVSKETALWWTEGAAGSFWCCESSSTYCDCCG